MLERRGIDGRLCWKDKGINGRLLRWEDEELMEDCVFQGNYIIPAACCVLILKIFDIPAYVSPTNFPAVIALFLLYG